MPLDVPTTADAVPAYEEPTDRPRLSLTADVLDFRTCRRKYGLNTVRDFRGAAPTAEFVGSFAHRSIETAWRRYRDTDEPPSPGAVVDILEGVRQDLLDEGRSPHSWPAVFHAGYQVARLLRTIASLDLYETVIDTERTFRRGADDYVLEGVVDMIREGPILWDFKAANDPRRRLADADATVRSRQVSRRLLEEYALQLRLYHSLAETGLGESPERCAVVFLGELGRADVDFADFDSLRAAWEAMTPDPLTRDAWAAQRRRATADEAPGLLYSVSNEPDEIDASLAAFESTAAAILECRRADEWPAPAESSLPRKQTCDDCDFLDSCDPAQAVRSNE